jgi:hypothetical protein
MTTRQPVGDAAPVAERLRLDAARLENIPWRKWGPYLSERQWGTVREDYSADGNAWGCFLLPYEQIAKANAKLSRTAMEYELLDTGVFDAGNYFDVVVEYAKASPEDVLVRVTATNRGLQAAAPRDAPGAGGVGSGANSITTWTRFAGSASTASNCFRPRRRRSGTPSGATCTTPTSSQCRTSGSIRGTRQWDLAGSSAVSAEQMLEGGRTGAFTGRKGQSR